MSILRLITALLLLVISSAVYSQTECDYSLKNVESYYAKYPEKYRPASTQITLQELKKEAQVDYEKYRKTLSKDEFLTEIKNYRDEIKNYEKNGEIEAATLSQYYLCILELAQKHAYSNVRPLNKKVQTVSSGPVSVSLIPTNNPVGQCYDIAYENRGDRYVDFFIKLTLSNNKTGEKGTSVWLGDNTSFDGLFGSANINKMNPHTPANSTRTGLYGGWLLAQGPFKFNNAPADYYGFDTVVESCNDITAEIPTGGVKWNENAYQRHYDACKSPIKRNRPIGC